MTEKITIFGDSIAKGLFLNNLKPENLKTNAVLLLEERLNTKIENNSKFGQTLKKVFERGIFDKFAKENHDGEMVVLALGGNDADYNWTEVEKSPQSFHAPRTPLCEFETMLDVSLKILKSSGAKVVVTSLCPVCAEDYFDNVLSKNFDAQKILEFLQGDKQNIYRHQELFNLAITKIAYQNNCTFFDYRSEMLKLNSLNGLLCQDGIHPNERGQQFVSNLAFEKLQQANFVEALKQKTQSLQNVVLSSANLKHFAFKQAILK